MRHALLLLILRYLKKHITFRFSPNQRIILVAVTHVPFSNQGLDFLTRLNELASKLCLHVVYP